MLLNDGDIYEFVRDTLGPIPSTYSLEDGAYFYPLVRSRAPASRDFSCTRLLWCLTGHYTPTSCPSYLTRVGFDRLRADNAKATDAFRLHTDSTVTILISVLRGLSPGSLTRAVIIDHLDRFAPGSRDVDGNVSELARALSSGGFVL